MFITKRNTFLDLAYIREKGNGGAGAKPRVTRQVSREILSLLASVSIIVQV